MADSQFDENSLCKDCVGCEKSDNPFFEGITVCKWYVKCTPETTGQDILDSIKANIRNNLREGNNNA
jgi:hypothetical protein